MNSDPPGAREPATASIARECFPWGTAQYRLDVVGRTEADVVEHAGGWLFDRALAGWAVTVLLTEHTNSRALRILGVDVLDLEQVLAEGGQGRQPHAVAVDTAVCDSDPRARVGLTRALADGGIEVVVWGTGGGQPFDLKVNLVRHHLSRAARSFKAHALAAAGSDAEPPEFEDFRTGTSAYPPVGADLTAIDRFTPPPAMTGVI